MRQKQVRVSQPRYISVRPEISAMAEEIQSKLHISFSALVARLIVEAHSKLIGTQVQTTQEELEEDPLS